MYDKLNQKVKIAIDNWNLLSFTKLLGIYKKANIIRFVILTNDKMSYKLLSDVNILVGKKHPCGDLVFLGFKSLEIKDKENSEYIDGNSTLLKEYKLTIFNDESLKTLNMNENEYISKLEIFYDKLISLFERYKK